MLLLLLEWLSSKGSNAIETEINNGKFLVVRIIMTKKKQRSKCAVILTNEFQRIMTAFLHNTTYQYSQKGNQRSNFIVEL